MPSLHHVGLSPGLVGGDGARQGLPPPSVSGPLHARGGHECLLLLEPAFIVSVPAPPSLNLVGPFALHAQSAQSLSSTLPPMPLLSTMSEPATLHCPPHSPLSIELHSMSSLSPLSSPVRWWVGTVGWVGGWCGREKEVHWHVPPIVTLERVDGEAVIVKGKFGSLIFF